LLYLDIMVLHQSIKYISEIQVDIYRKLKKSLFNLNYIS